MAEAVALGERGRLTAAPNPWVGCVIVAPDGAVAGRGFHRRAGGAPPRAPPPPPRPPGGPPSPPKPAAPPDGRPAAAAGTSQWITGPEARADAHPLRAESGAVVVGAGTAVADLPALTWRNLEFEDDLVPPQPLRVLLDAAGRVPAIGPLFDTALAPILVLTTSAADPEAKRAWKAAGAEV